MDRKIENDKDIARKKRRQNVAKLASMPNGAPHSGSETAEALALKVELNAGFPVRERARYEPTFPPLPVKIFRRRNANCILLSSSAML
jgi:hypothetical protein